MVQPKKRNSPGSKMIPGTRTETLFGITHEHFFSDVKKGDIKSRYHRNGNQDIHFMHGLTLLELETVKINIGILFYQRAYPLQIQSHLNL